MYWFDLYRDKATEHGSSEIVGTEVLFLTLYTKLGPADGVREAR